MKYNIELDSDEGILIANLLMSHIKEMRGKLTPMENAFRNDLHDRIHPTNNQSTGKDESLIKVKIGEGVMAHDRITHLNCLEEIAFITDKAVYKVNSCDGCFSLSLDRIKKEE